MTEPTHQIIRVRDTDEDITVSVMEYPYQQVGILYIKFIVYDTITLEPQQFLTVQPQDVLYRRHKWSADAELELLAAAKEAEEGMRNYHKAVEDELARRAEANAPEIVQPEGADPEGLFG